MMTHPKNHTKAQPAPRALVAAARAEFTRHTRLLGCEGWASPGSEMGRPTAGVFAVVVEDNLLTKPVARNEDVLLLDEHWHTDPALLAAALPIFRRAIEGVVQVGDAMLLSAGWKSHAVDTAHSHHGGAVWKLGKDTVAMQVYVRHLPPGALSYEGDFERRARTQVTIAVTADGPGAHEAYAALTEGLAQQCESINALRDDCDAVPANDAIDPTLPFRIEGFRLLEDHAANAADAWFAACPRMYFAHAAELGDRDLMSLAGVVEPKPWWQRGKLGVPENLRRVLGKLRGSVQLIRVDEHGLTGESQPTRLTVSGALPRNPFPGADRGLARGQIQIVMSEPGTHRPALVYRVEPGEDIPPAILRKLQANVAPHAERLCRRAILNSLRFAGS